MSQPLYGPETKKAMDNFPISGWTMPSEFLSALAMIKEHAAAVNGELGEIPKEIARAIEEAASELKEDLLSSSESQRDESRGGKTSRRPLQGRSKRVLDHFPVDVFQTGSGTSTNMNMNEVVATLAVRGQGSGVSKRMKIHPNDHVNRCQSSNDVIPTALHLSCALALRDGLLPALKVLRGALEGKVQEFHAVIKMGRTHLMEAVPMRLGDEFRSYATLLRSVTKNLELVTCELCSLPLGGTAAGTGVNAHPEFASRVIERLKKETKLPLKEAGDHIAAQSFPLALLELSSSLRQLALVLHKIANDIRLGVMLQELKLPELQKGSSAMPGKVNPVLCESVLQVSSWVVGADATIAHAVSESSNFELCTSLPLLAEKLLPSLRMLRNVCHTFADCCVAKITADKARIADRTCRSPMLATALVPHIGYDKASDIAEEAMEKGMTIYEIALKRTRMGEKTLKKILNPSSMV